MITTTSTITNTSNIITTRPIDRPTQTYPTIVITPRLPQSTLSRPKFTHTASSTTITTTITATTSPTSTTTITTNHHQYHYDHSSCYHDQHQPPPPPTPTHHHPPGDVVPTVRFVSRRRLRSVVGELGAKGRGSSPCLFSTPAALFFFVSLR
jgi:hypothetical protein